jgi:hypothetical protein
MAREPPIRRQSLLACKNARDHRCSRTSLPTWPITRRRDKFRSHIDAAVGGQSVTCVPRRHFSTRFEINLKVSERESGNKREFIFKCATLLCFFADYDQLAKDFTRVFLNTEPSCLQNAHLFDVVFLVGQSKQKSRFIGVRAILGVRSRVFQVSGLFLNTNNPLPFLLC